MTIFYALSYPQFSIMSKRYPTTESVCGYSLNLDLDFQPTLDEAKKNVFDANYAIIEFDFDLKKGVVTELFQIYTPSIGNNQLKWRTTKITTENTTPGAIERITDQIQTYIKSCNSLNKVLTENPRPIIFNLSPKADPKAKASTCSLTRSNRSQPTRSWDQLLNSGLVTTTCIATTLAMASGQADPSHSKMIPISKQDGYDQSIAGTVGLVVLGATAVCATMYSLYQCSQRRNKNITDSHSPSANKSPNKAPH